MEEGHHPLWRHFIESIAETGLSRRAVLDIGCNRDGFLRLLHVLKPFRHAIGVDIAVDSIAAARALAGVSPIDNEIAPSIRHHASPATSFLPPPCDAQHSFLATVRSRRDVWSR